MRKITGAMAVTVALWLAACGGATNGNGGGGGNAAALENVTEGAPGAPVVAPAAATAGPVSAPPSPFPTPVRAAAATARRGPGSCAAEIGRARADARARVCRDVSPATRPPCNAANSCALIEDEIARSCALFDGDGPPMRGCGPDPKGMQAAADVVRRYYSALNARDWGTAWQQWGDDGRPGQSYAAFERGFRDTRSTRVTIGRMEPGDAGAGSVYQPVPVTVEAVTADGTRQRFTGTYTVRRVNGVDGASPSQLRWHLDTASLRPAR